jgi:hypothetical protein
MSSTQKELTPQLKHQQKLYELHDKQRLIAKWHVKLYEATDGAIELPWSPVEDWIFLNVSEFKNVPAPTEDNPDKTERKYVTDTDASLAKLAAVAKFAAKSSMVQGIEKKYTDGDFKLIVKLGEDNSIRYSVNREAVCTKKVTGTKVIPATPEREVEEYEWDCKPVSLLGFNAEPTDAA